MYGGKQDGKDNGCWNCDKRKSVRGVRNGAPCFAVFTSEEAKCKHWVRSVVDYEANYVRTIR